MAYFHLASCTNTRYRSQERLTESEKLNRNRLEHQQNLIIKVRPWEGRAVTFYEGRTDPWAAAPKLACRRGCSLEAQPSLICCLAPTKCPSLHGQTRAHADVGRSPSVLCRTHSSPARWTPYSGL